MDINRSVIAAGATGALLAALLGPPGVSTGAQGTLAHRSTEVCPGPAPTFDPARFAHPVVNPYFPVTPGLTTRLRGAEEDERFVEVVRVTHRTRTILGVAATVFRDVVRRADGSLAEKTHDWYAGDDRGNVWYLGEDTASYDENGHLEDRDGSWQAGVDGARPGVLVPADARCSSATRPEFQKGEAEDQSWFVEHRGHVRVHGRRFHDVVRSFEWSRLEPGVISQKLYARGLGIVAEHDVSGGDERFWLVGHHT